MTTVFFSYFLTYYLVFLHFFLFPLYYPWSGDYFIVLIFSISLFIFAPFKCHLKYIFTSTSWVVNSPKFFVQSTFSTCITLSNLFNYHIPIWLYLSQLTYNAIFLSTPYLVYINLSSFYVDHFLNIVARLPSNSMKLSSNIWYTHKSRVTAYSLHSIVRVFIYTRWDEIGKCELV